MVMLRSLLSCLAIATLSIALAAPVPKQLLKRDDTDPQKSLESFLKALADQEPKRAYSLVASDTKTKGDPIASGTQVDYDSFLTEVQGRPATKFGAYSLGQQRIVSDAEVRITVHFEDGDNDETLIVKVGNQWYVADPIHIIR